MKSPGLLALVAIWTAGAGALAAVEGDRPHEAQLAQAGSEPQTVYVIEENFEGVRFSYDRTATAAQGGAQWGNIDAIDYAPVRDRDYVIAQRDVNQGNYADGATRFAAFAAEAETQYARFQAHHRRIKALEAAGDIAGAIAAIDEFVAAEPKHPQTIELRYHKGLLQLNQRAYDAASATFQALESMGRAAGYFADHAFAFGVSGRAQVALARDDAAAALTLCEQGMNQLGRERQPTAYARLGLIAARAKRLQDDSAGAIAQARDIRFLGHDAGIHASAHLLIAELLQADQPQKAFEFAAIAALTYGDQPAGADARRLASRLATDLSSDEDLSVDQRREYKQYLGRL